ncbi:MAG: hypothetical protein WC796_04445 [Candidatus Pacearchaeota archaeon]|jgi:hypothetical protein
MTERLSEKVYRIHYEPITNPFFDSRSAIGLDLERGALEVPVQRLFHDYQRHSGLITRLGARPDENERHVETYLIHGCLVQFVHPTEDRKFMTEIFLTGEDKDRMRETATDLGLPFDEDHCFTRQDGSIGFGPEIK